MRYSPVTEVAKLCSVVKKNTDEIRRWYAVYTKPRWEKKVHSLLEQKGLESYCPLNKVRRKWSDRYKIVEEPLFKSYVFVRITESQKMSIRLVSGIVNFVYWLGKPAVIKNEDIEKILRFLNEYPHVEVEVMDGLEKGARVLIKKGVFMDQSARIISDRNKWAVLEIDSLGCKLIAQLPKHQLVKVSDQRNPGKEK